ncbi:MAG: hypothetical protein KDF67_18200 [Ottowia sp.]|nr:hypothetical protein [Ottowia sp.]
MAQLIGNLEAVLLVDAGRSNAGLEAFLIGVQQFDLGHQRLSQAGLHLDRSQHHGVGHLPDRRRDQADRQGQLGGLAARCRLVSRGFFSGHLDYPPEIGAGPGTASKRS